jgi:hypothetical protein
VATSPSWGEPPADLVDATIYLAEPSFTDAAGFDGYTRYDGPLIEKRTFGFGRDELRLVRSGVAVAHAAEQAARMRTRISAPAALSCLRHGWPRPLPREAVRHA